MSHPNGEAIQIVRKRKKNEPIPNYSTAALLYGCTWPVIIKKPDRFDPAFQIMGLGKGAEIMKARRDERFAPHRETIIRMLRERIPMTKIGRVIGIPADTVSLYVKSHGLKGVPGAVAVKDK